ncbi:hypothetical protein DK59_2240 [Brucella abortus bv. 4 str. 292]|nr:hypothetical protein DK59_2240 [Brucella abortus bv. 4 str. 292]
MCDPNVRLLSTPRPNFVPIFPPPSTDLFIKIK